MAAEDFLSGHFRLRDKPDELVGAVVLLASASAGSFVTGAIVAVGGGFTAMTI